MLLQSSWCTRGAEPTLAEVKLRLKFESLVTVKGTDRSLCANFLNAVGDETSCLRDTGEASRGRRDIRCDALGTVLTVFLHIMPPAEGQVQTDSPLIPLPATGERSQVGVSKRDPGGQRTTR